MQRRLDIFPTMEELELDFQNDFQTDDLETTGTQLHKEDEHVFKKPRSVQSIAQRIKVIGKIRNLTNFPLERLNATPKRLRIRKRRMR